MFFVGVVKDLLDFGVLICIGGFGGVEGLVDYLVIECVIVFFDVIYLFVI